MSKYEVRSVVCDYGVFEEGELKLICSSAKNALLIKDIMEKDIKYGSGFNGSPSYKIDDFNAFEEKRKI